MITWIAQLPTWGKLTVAGLIVAVVFVVGLAIGFARGADWHWRQVRRRQDDEARVVPGERTIPPGDRHFRAEITE